MSWELRLGASVVVVGSKGCEIGRASEADLPLADPLVSRRHAVIRKTMNGIEIEDLGSQQGVRVNGIPIRGRMALAHGDRIAICAYEITVSDTSRRSNRSTRERAVTSDVPRAQARPLGGGVPTGATGQASPIEVLLAGAEDALARGHAAECAFALPRVVDVLSRIERGSGAQASLLRRYAICSLRAARLHNRTEWIDQVVEVHSVKPRVMHAATVDALEGALDVVKKYERAKLRDYVEAISASPTDRPYEKFCVDRLRTLVGLT